MYKRTKYKVKKPFLSHEAKRVYSEGDIYSGGDSTWTKRLLENGFIRHLDDSNTSEEKKIYNPEIIAESKLAKIAIASDVDTDTGSRYFGYSVRLVKDIKKKEK